VNYVIGLILKLYRFILGFLLVFFINLMHIRLSWLLVRC